MTRFAFLVPVLLCLSAGTAEAFEQPPITSPQDKSCRDEAASKVFDVPDPENLGVHAIGKKIYFACMDRAQAALEAPAKPARRVKKTG